jgi:hypothetical protein
VNEPPLSSRLLIGALAGFAATAVMTAAMRRLHARLPADERYPLPPREIAERVSPGATGDDALRDLSLAAHFAYGAAAGAVLASGGTRHNDAVGALFGAGVWTASYFGWVPAFDILRPASEHPARRNALMVGVHLVWGSVTSWTIRELAAARATIVAGGPLRDATVPQATRGERR